MDHAIIVFISLTDKLRFKILEDIVQDNLKRLEAHHAFAVDEVIIGIALRAVHRELTALAHLFHPLMQTHQTQGDTIPT